MSDTRVPIGADSAGTVDLLVIGGGMAGLSAAAKTASEGGSVILVERGERLGGSAAFAGYIWTAPTVEVLREVNPDGDPVLAAALIEGFEPAMEWVRSLDVACGPAVTVLGFGRGHSVDMQAYLRTCERVVLASSTNEILLGATVERLVMEDGAVCGAVVTGADGTSRAINSRSTLLATGGFQGDRELTAELIHDQAASMPLRSNPWSIGDGLRLGLGAGGVFGEDDAGFYGHLVPNGVPLDDPVLFVELALYYSEHGMLFNVNGERFVDETIGDHLSTMAVLAQPEGRALLVADQRVHDDWIVASYVEGIAPFDKFAAVHRHGARCAVPDGLDDFAYMPEEWGYPGDRIREAIERANETLRDDPGGLTPGRQLDALPLDRPPYYVVDVQAAITFTLGGLLIDEQARVVDATGTPIPGLLAAGADAGGVYVRAYAGGLAAALVFGLRAASTSLRAAGAVQGG